MKETHQGGINNLLKFSRPHWLGGEEEEEEGQGQTGGGAGHLDPSGGGGGGHREQCHLGSPAGRGHSRNINNKNLKKVLAKSIFGCS